MPSRPTPHPTPHPTYGPATLQSAHESIIAAQVKTKIWLELSGEFFVGDGGIHLLGGILRHGSLARTVREIGWSYRHAWGYLRRAERLIQTPIVRNRAGRGTARGMELTETGHLLLERLRALRDRIDDALGPTGPTPTEVAARGRNSRRPPRPRRARGERESKARRAE
ncbi:MAG: winged helix-turn-helix domain-containing protein [Candidatus Rokuibacteriota bacterium]